MTSCGACQRHGGRLGMGRSDRLSRRVLVEDGSEEELTAAVLAWHGAVQGAHAIFLQATKVLGDDPRSLAADTTLSALQRLQARIESQLPSAGAASPDSSPDRKAAPAAP